MFDLAYNPIRDGDVHRYVEEYNYFSKNPVFNGYKQYQLLWKRDFLIPNKTIILLPWNEHLIDLELIVLGQYNLKGNFRENDSARKYKATHIFGQVPYWQAVGLNIPKIR